MKTSTTDQTYFADILRSARSADGRDLLGLSYERPVMLVFLRHFGCTFCREVLRDLGKIRHEIEAKGISLVLVHMSAPEYAEQMLEKFKLSGTLHISSTDKRLYEEFGLRRGSLKQFVRKIIHGCFLVRINKMFVEVWELAVGFDRPVKTHRIEHAQFPIPDIAFQAPLLLMRDQPPAQTRVRFPDRWVCRLGFQQIDAL